MKRITLLATCDAGICNGCGICPRVCPTLAMHMVARKAVVDEDRCIGCGRCRERCEINAIAMDLLEEPQLRQVPIAGLPVERIESLCRKAGFHPSQVVCLCTSTRAEEVAAAILEGAHSPEEISLRTGVRGGCGSSCLQPVLRLLEAAGVQATPPKGGWQWYGRAPTIQEIPEAVKAKYASRGFHFDEDIRLLASIVHSDTR